MIQLQIIYIIYRGVSVLLKYPPSQNHNKADINVWKGNIENMLPITQKMRQRTVAERIIKRS